MAAERMSALGRMTAGLAHELKTPLAAAATACQTGCQLLDELSESIGHPDVTEADLQEIVAELRQAATLNEQSVQRAARFVAVLELLSFRLRKSRVRVDTASGRSGRGRRAS